MPRPEASGSVRLKIQRAPLTTSERAVKRSVDLTLGFIALVFFIPLLLLTAIAIRLEGNGPVIFRQSRKGFNGRQFVMWKFRTMTVQEDGDAVMQATRKDARVPASANCYVPPASMSCRNSSMFCAGRCR